MTTRTLTGTVQLPDGTAIESGRLQVEIVGAGPSSGGTVVAGRSLYDIVDGAILDLATGLTATIASPATYTVTVIARGRNVLTFRTAVADSGTPITFGDMWRARSDVATVAVDPAIVHEGDALTRLTSESIAAGYRPEADGDGGISWTPDPLAGGETVVTTDMIDAANGVAGLDSGGQIAVAALPGTVMTTDIYDTDADGKVNLAAEADHAADADVAAAAKPGSALETALAAKASGADLTTEASTRAAADSALDTRLTTLEESPGGVTSVDGQTGAVDLSAVYIPSANLGKSGGPSRLIMVDPRDFGAVAGSVGTVSNLATRDANTVAINDCITAARAAGAGVAFGEFYWCSVDGLSYDGGTLHLRGLGGGWYTGMGTPDESGTLFYAENVQCSIEGVRFWGPCQYLPGTPGTTYTTTLLSLNSDSGTQSFDVTRCNILGGYTGLKLRNMMMGTVSRNLIQHARGEDIHISQPASSDNGDLLVFRNHLHVANIGSPGYVAGTTAAVRVTSASVLMLDYNKVWCQSLQAFDVNLSEAAFDDGGTIQPISHMIRGNMFDSAGAAGLGAACIKYRSSNTLGGHRLTDLAVAHNTGFNPSVLLDLSGTSGAFTEVHLRANTVYGGGLAKLAGAIDLLTLQGNSASDRTGSWVPAKPVESTATITATAAQGNSYTGFDSAPDVADSYGAGTGDVTNAVRTLTIGAGVATITPPDHLTPDHAKLIVTENAALTFAGIADGDEGEIIVAQSVPVGEGPWSVTWGTEPEGFTYAGTPSTSFGTTDDDTNLVSWKVRDTLIYVTVGSTINVTGYTTEAAPSIAIQDAFTGTENAGLNGRTPDTAGTATWYDLISNKYLIKSNKVAPNSGVSLPNTGQWCIVNAATDGGSGTSSIEASITLDGTETEFYALVANHNALTSWTTWQYWAVGINAATGAVRLMYAPPNAANVQKATWSYGGAIPAGTYVVKLDASGGDTILVDFAGSTVITHTEASRPGKANTYFGICGGGLTANTRWDDLTVYI